MTEVQWNLLQLKRVVVSNTIKRQPLFPHDDGQPAEALGLHQAATALGESMCKMCCSGGCTHWSTSTSFIEAARWGLGTEDGSEGVWKKEGEGGS